MTFPFHYLRLLSLAIYCDKVLDSEQVIRCSSLVAEWPAGGGTYHQIIVFICGPMRCWADKFGESGNVDQNNKNSSGSEIYVPVKLFYAHNLRFSSKQCEWLMRWVRWLLMIPQKLCAKKIIRIIYNIAVNVYYLWWYTRRGQTKRITAKARNDYKLQLEALLYKFTFLLPWDSLLVSCEFSVNEKW